MLKFMTQHVITVALILLPVSLASAGDAADCGKYIHIIEENYVEIPKLQTGGLNPDPATKERHDELVRQTQEAANKAASLGCPPPTFLVEKSTYKEVLPTSGVTSRMEGIPLAPGGESKESDPQYMGGWDFNSLIPVFLAFAGLLIDDSDEDDAGNGQVVQPEDVVRGQTCGEIGSNQNVSTYANYCQGQEDVYIPVPIANASQPPATP